MRTVTTRSQRRMERKQAMLLLLMVLAVALVSFALGVMVGRSGSAEVATNDAGGGSGRDVVRKLPAPAPVDPDEGPAGEADANLTFYETLPKGPKSPIGSGINLPPEKKQETVEADPSDGKVAEKKVTQERRKPVSDEKVAKPPSVPEDDGATFILQVASFRAIKAALTLQEKLHRKGYPAQVREVDLGAKGVWSRVVVGPFDSRSAAQKTLERLEREEGLAPMIRKG